MCHFPRFFSSSSAVCIYPMYIHYALFVLCERAKQQKKNYDGKKRKERKENCLYWCSEVNWCKRKGTNENRLRYKIYDQFFLWVSGRRGWVWWCRYWVLSWVFLCCIFMLKYGNFFMFLFCTGVGLLSRLWILFRLKIWKLSFCGGFWIFVEGNLFKFWEYLIFWDFLESILVVQGVIWILIIFAASLKN